MHNVISIHCLNPIAAVGLDLFSDDYQKVDDLKDAEAVLSEKRCNA